MLTTCRATLGEIKELAKATNSVMKSSARAEDIAQKRNVIAIRFLQRLVAERPAMRRSPGIAGHLATRYKIGVREAQNPGEIRYCDDDFRRAQERLGFIGANSPEGR